MTDSEPIESAPQEEISPPEEVEPGAREKPALTIVIQSWATPILAIIMLIIGLAGGYFGRPLLDGNNSTALTVAQSTSEIQPTTDPVAAATAEARGQQLLTVVVGQTRHFLGDENAPVTLVEFSDFQ